MLPLISRSAGFGALIATICLNTAGLLWLRLYSGSADQGLLILAMGYIPMALGMLHKRPKSRAYIELNPHKAWKWKWISIWATSVTMIYAVFLINPNLITLSQLIIAQSLIPLLAVIASGDTRSKAGRQESLGKLIPLTLLLVLAWLQPHDARTSGTVFAFALICGCFFLAQLSMRKLARLQDSFWVLPRFALLAMVLVFMTGSLFAKTIVQPQSGELIFYGAMAGLLLFLIQGGYFYGIAQTPPLLSAIALSSSVPISIFAEWSWLGREVSAAEFSLAMGYCLSILAIAIIQKSPQHSRVPSFESEERAA